MRTYTKEDVEFHSDRLYAQRNPAVNVKLYKWPDEQLLEKKRKEYDWNPHFTWGWIDSHISDEYMNAVFEMVCRWRWEDLEYEAKEIFGKYVKIWQTGRSGGWCEVEGLPDIEHWDAVMLAKWRKFEGFCKRTVDYIPEEILDNIYNNEFYAWVHQ